MSSACGSPLEDVGEPAGTEETRTGCFLRPLRRPLLQAGEGGVGCGGWARGLGWPPGQVLQGDPGRRGRGCEHTANSPTPSLSLPLRRKQSVCEVALLV